MGFCDPTLSERPKVSIIFEAVSSKPDFFVMSSETLLGGGQTNWNETIEHWPPSALSGGRCRLRLPPNRTAPTKGSQTPRASSRSRQQRQFGKKNPRKEEPRPMYTFCPKSPRIMEGGSSWALAGQNDDGFLRSDSTPGQKVRTNIKAVRSKSDFPPCPFFA